MFRSDKKGLSADFLVFIACLAFAVPLRANPAWQEKAKLTASDGINYDEFGHSVSISGNYAIVGVLRDDDYGNTFGSAYIFKQSADPNDPNWYQQPKLLASDGQALDCFGRSVSIGGGYAIVGAYRHDVNGTNSGSAYIFKPSDDPNDPNWYQQVKLTASDAAMGDFFGCSVSIDGDYAIVGAPYADGNEPNSGSAYIFKRSDNPTDANWYQQAKLTASDGATDDGFGVSVSINGGYAIAGAFGDDGYTGSAYIFKRSDTPNDPNWYQQPKLLAFDRTATDQFGISVSISDEYAIVGADGDDDIGTNSGSAYIFKRNDSTWEHFCKLIATYPYDASFDAFGRSVSISGNIAIVGAAFDDVHGTNSGAAYIFKYDGTTWNQQIKLKAFDRLQGDCFGYSVSISTGYAIVGAIGDDDNGNISGSAYIFERFMPPGDLNSDYCVNWDDVNILSEQWLDPFQAKLTASDGDDFDRFGHSVSISGGYAIAGSPSDSSAYIFKRNGKSWTQQPKLTADPSQFGYAVFINANVAIVSAPYDDDNGYMSGSAYIFKRSDDANDPNWYQQTKLLASDGTPYQQFGQDVSLDANYAVVGAPFSAYIFKRSNAVNDANWYQQTKIDAPDPNNIYSGFGTTVSISNNYLIIGDGGDEENGPFSGSAFIYKRSVDVNDPNWYQQTKLLPSDGNDYNYFGYSVSTCGDYCIAGAYGDEPNGYNSGSAYIFKQSTDPNDPNWYEQAKLIASDSTENDMFGQDVYISGNYAIVGAYANDDCGNNSGSAYIFKRNGSTWSEVYKFAPADGASMDFFGRCVSISNDYCIVGAPNDDDKGTDSGSAYIFKTDCSTADINGDCFVNFFDYAILADWWLHCH
jgi:hypothetical protein